MYGSLSDQEKKDFSLQQAGMGRAFSLSSFAAFELFVSRRCEPGATVDVFLSGLRRLATLVPTNPDDAWILCAFIRRFPDAVRSQLQALNQIQNMTVSDGVEKARAITSLEGIGAVSAAAEGYFEEPPSPGLFFQQQIRSRGQAMKSHRITVKTFQGSLLSMWVDRTRRRSMSAA